MLSKRQGLEGLDKAGRNCGRSGQERRRGESIEEVSKGVKCEGNGLYL